MTTHTQATGDVPQCLVCGQYMYGPHHCPHPQVVAFTAYTDDKVRALIIRIAADHQLTKGGHSRRMSREEMVRLAREACLAMGWEWSKSNA